MTGYKVGDLVLIPFPFTDQSAVKKRPALILKRISPKTLPTLIIIAMITSRIEGENIAGDCVIEHWQEAGLVSISKVRLAKLVTVEEKLVLKRLGTLHPKDIALLGRSARDFFKTVLAK